ncbi:interleukin-1 receptor type 1 isoform X6 [Moschus berezovskii]|uniref:interleukin-1 receptor type 1 isoform X6 n=1 Tax=Moschus berezovskii TaxID=68408 RepID=UPI002444B826|nr:interleukin-1 receptor type 1 isoform X6 [Moschus berezovskii]XP_055255867.1 interleukin-1 receptor type 1 isoform X6 [Moschus berezovskii]XP_055255868.1 interleukin-1 receptor type 1 isoform X6 [Moschus berezovskii]XP_055255869.1 interleukin-1 receptor type 1 isoform X6 [Moschus berezovskii]
MGRAHSESSALCPEGRAAAVQGPARDAEGRAAPEGAGGLPAPPQRRPSWSRARARGGAGRECGSRPDRGDVMRRLPGRLRPPGLPHATAGRQQSPERHTIITLLLQQRKRKAAVATEDANSLLRSGPASYRKRPPQ